MSAREYHITVKWSQEDEGYVAKWEAPDADFGVCSDGDTPWQALEELAKCWCLTAMVVLEDDWFEEDADERGA